MNKHTFNRMTQVMTSRIEDLPPAEELRPEHNLKEDLDFDSMEYMDIAMAFNAAFDIQLDLTRIRNFNTLGDWCNEIDRLQHGKE